MYLTDDAKKWMCEYITQNKPITYCVYCIQEQYINVDNKRWNFCELLKKKTPREWRTSVHIVYRPVDRSSKYSYILVSIPSCVKTLKTIVVLRLNNYYILNIIHDICDTLFTITRILNMYNNNTIWINRLGPEDVSNLKTILFHFDVIKVKFSRNKTSYFYSNDVYFCFRNIPEREEGGDKDWTK